MLVGSCTFVWLESFNGAVDLCISDVFKCFARRGVFDPVVLWGQEKEGVIQCLCFVLVFLYLFIRPIRLFRFQVRNAGFCAIPRSGGYEMVYGPDAAFVSSF